MMDTCARVKRRRGGGKEGGRRLRACVVTLLMEVQVKWNGISIICIRLKVKQIRFGARVSCGSTIVANKLRLAAPGSLCTEMQSDDGIWQRKFRIHMGISVGAIS